MAGKGGKRSTSFKPGQSGNPGGRPKIIGDIREMAREHTAVAMQALVDIVMDKKAPHSAKAVAATALMDRGWGKPTQTIQANISILDRMSYDDRRELESAINGILTGREGGTGETAH